MNCSVIDGPSCRSPKNFSTLASRLTSGSVKIGRVSLKVKTKMREMKTIATHPAVEKTAAITALRIFREIISAC